MSKYLIIGDTHAKPDNLYKIEKLFQIVESKGLPTVWLGDLLDTKDIVRAQCLNAYFNYFRNSSLKHIILVGNHDWVSSECAQHALEPLKALNNVTIVDKLHHEGNILFMPYLSATGAFIASIYDTKYLFMHQGVNGCDYGNGFIAENELPIEALCSYDKVISGHFHCYQQKDNLTYLGTPFSHSFGESNQQKYLGIFNDEDGSLELIKTDFPRHMTVEFHLSNDGDHILDPIDFYDYNRVLLIGNREQIDSFDRSKYPDTKFIECPRLGPNKSIIKETQTPSQMYENWFKEVKKETNQELFQLGLEILKDVS